MYVITRNDKKIFTNKNREKKLEANLVDIDIVKNESGNYFEKI